MNEQLILVVEDEVAIADTIVYALRTEGFAVHHVTEGGRSLAAIAELAPSLLILDVGLPDISGFDLCRQIRNHSQVPIIFLTARSDEIDRVVGLEIGADDYMVKPFSPRELTARVRARLRRLPANDTKPNALSDGIELDQSSLEARFRGRALALTRYEFRLLAVLHKSPGRVYSREQLLAMVWDDPTATFDRTVDTHIKTLRQKLRDIDAQTELIRTHRGSGYSMKTT